MKSSPIIVLGTGRSGTSAVAGILHYLNIHMGNSFMRANEHNPTGYFEDEEFRNITNSYLRQHIPWDAWEAFFENTVRVRNERHKIWGWKHPVTVALIDHILKRCPDATLIWCKRDPHRSVVSCMKSEDWPRERVEQLIYPRYEKLQETLKDREHLPLEFEDIIKKPEETVDKIIKYLEIKPTEDQRRRAIESIYRDKSPKKIMIAVYTMGEVRQEVAQWIPKLEKDPRHQVTVEWRTDVPCDSNVNRTIKERFLPSNCDFFLSIDEDNPPFQNPLDLVELNKDIIGFPTPCYKPGQIYWNVGMDTKDGATNIPKEERLGLQEVDIVGKGCMLIARRVLEKIPSPFRNQYSEDGIRKLGEDLDFCRKAKKAGFRIWTHWDYPCAHFKTVDLLEIATALGT